jgi:hypothetical protein
MSETTYHERSTEPVVSACALSVCICHVEVVVA